MSPTLYHISFKELPVVLNPKLPAGSNEGSPGKYPEPDIPRVSMATSIAGAFRAVYPNVSRLFEEENYPYMEFFVYQYVPKSGDVLISTETLTNDRMVHDAHVTGEVIATTPTSIKFIKKIKILNTSKDVGLKYRPFNDDNEPELYHSPKVITVADIDQPKVTNMNPLIHWVPKASLPSVLKNGLLGQKAILDRPDIIEEIASSRGITTAKVISDLEDNINRSGGSAPNFIFGLPDKSVKLSKQHPSKLQEFVVIAFDQVQYLKDFPNSRIFGLELSPITDEGIDLFYAMKDDDTAETRKAWKQYRDSRAHDLSREEFNALVSKGSATWNTYSADDSNSQYAPDVPHVEIGDASTVIPPKYLTVLEDINYKVSEMKHTFTQFMRNYRHLLLERAFLMDLLMAVKDRPSQNSDSLTPGTIVTMDSGEFAYFHQGSFIILDTPGYENKPFDIHDEIIVKEGDIENSSRSPIDTSVGQYVLNYTLNASIFKDAIPYENGFWNIGKFEKRVAAGLISGEFTMDDHYSKYMDQGIILGHFCEISVPTMSKKTLTSDPQIAEVKAALQEKYKGRLHEPEVQSLIEKKLEEIDMAWVKGDPSEGFLRGIGVDKAFRTARKKMFLTQGAVTEFGDPTGKRNFIMNSLSEGWTPEDFDKIADDVRNGSFSRGKETAKGGGDTKFILRIFSDLKVSEDDCGTTKYLPAYITLDTASMYFGRHVKTVGSKNLEILSKDNLEKYLDKVIDLRSPIYCKTNPGLCFTCVGDKFRRLDIAAIGVLAVSISSRFMGLSMKAMHADNLEMFEVDFNDYVV